MRVKYFPGTDTALVEFTDHEVEETKKISETIYVDLDTDVTRLLFAGQKEGSNHDRLRIGPWQSGTTTVRPELVEG